jgi:hypothetical protein
VWIAPVMAQVMMVLGLRAMGQSLNSI